MRKDLNQLMIIFENPNNFSLSERRLLSRQWNVYAKLLIKKKLINHINLDNKRGKGAPQERMLTKIFLY